MASHLGSYRCSHLGQEQWRQSHLLVDSVAPLVLLGVPDGLEHLLESLLNTLVDLGVPLLGGHLPTALRHKLHEPLLEVPAGVKDGLVGTVEAAAAIIVLCLG